MRLNRNGLAGQPPARPFLSVLFETIAGELRHRFDIATESYSPCHVAGTFEAGGKRYRIIVAPVGTELTLQTTGEN